MSAKERIWRYCVMFFGIFVLATGISFATKSDLGTSAISVIPYTLSEIIPNLTYGTWVAIFNMLLAVSQILLNGKNTNYFDIVQQLVLCLFFGYFVDAAMFLLQFYNPTFYVARVFTLLLAVATIGFGAYLTLICHVGMMAGDAFARALSKRINKDFGVTRVISDSTMVIIAVVMNLVFLHGLVCVREGTVIAALCTGLVVRFYSQHLEKFEYFILPMNREQAAQEEKNVIDTGDHFVITIAREHGSGGQYIGRALAEKLGMAFYDSEEIAKRAAVIAAIPSDNDADSEYNLSPLEIFYSRYAGTVDKEDESRIDRMFQADSEIIRSLAAKEDCVIVGRLANWILEDHQNLMRVFISASKEDRIAFVMNEENMEYDEAETAIARADRRREEHCRYCTGKRWYDADGYDLTLNASRYPNGRALEVLANAATSVRV